jgi:hypothetical protein
MIQNLSEMIRRYCAFGLEYKDKDGITHDWKTLLPALEIAYNSSIHSSTKKSPFEVERGFCPRLPRDKFRSRDVDIHPTSLSFANMLNKAREYATQCVRESVEYNKERWDKTHREPEFSVGEQVLLSTVNFNNIQGPKKLRDQFVGPFVISKLVGPNAVELILHGELERRHPVFPVSLIKKYTPPEASDIRQKKSVPVVVIPPYVPEGEKKFLKILKEKRVKDKDGKDTLLYLVRYKDRGADGDEWLPGDKVPNSKVTLRAFRAAKRDTTSQ